MKQRGFSVVVLVIVIAVLAVVGATGFLVWPHNPTKSPASTIFTTQTPIPTPTVPTSWPTYNSAAFSFSLKYPASFHADDCHIGVLSHSAQSQVCFSDRVEHATNQQPYNGFQIFADPTADDSLSQYVRKAEQLSRSHFQARSDSEPQGSATQKELTVSGKPAVLVYYPWDKLTAAYIDVGASPPLFVIVMTEKSPGSFDQFSQVLGSFIIPSPDE